MKRTQSTYMKALIVFISFLFVFLVVLDLIIIKNEHMSRVESMRNYLNEELELIGTYITESLLRYDFSTVEQFVNQWGKGDSQVISLEVVTPQGRTLTRYDSGQEPQRVMRFENTVTYEDQHVVDLVLVEDLEKLNSEMALMARRLIARSLMIFVVLGCMLWMIFRIFAMIPLEEEINLRKKAEEELLQVQDGLEKAVSKRTAQLESVNQQLVNEIQERKAAVELVEIALAEKDMLLQEIHHRVKNNLQVISGMLQVQLNRIKDEALSDMLKASQYRIMSMALVHDELYRSKELTRIDFSSYVRSLVENLHHSYVKSPEKIRLHFQLEDIPLVVDTAIPCGLILSELLINAFKHAFPGQREGDITIAFEELEDNSFNLSIQDNGVGFSRDLKLDDNTSLGLNLVNVLVDQLHGNLEILEQDGTRYEIHFREYHEAGTGVY